MKKLIMMALFATMALATTPVFQCTSNSCNCEVISDTGGMGLLFGTIFFVVVTFMLFMVARNNKNYFKKDED